MSPHPPSTAAGPTEHRLRPQQVSLPVPGSCAAPDLSFVNSAVYRADVCPGFLSTPPGPLGYRALEFRSGHVGICAETLLKRTLPEPSGGDA